MPEQEHRERRGYHLRCLCGYEADSAEDLEEHRRVMQEERDDDA